MGRDNSYPSVQNNLGLLQTDNNGSSNKSLVDLGFKNGSTLAVVHNQNTKVLSQNEQIKIKRQLYIEIGNVFKIDGLSIFQMKNQQQADIIYEE